VHSNKFVYIDKNFKFNKKKIKADAIITDQKKLPIAVLTADCVPILLFDHKKNMIAAIHAGWKGALKGIIQKVVDFMVKKGCIGNNIIAAIGPCIGNKSYNVRNDFKKKFLIKNKRNKIFFKKINNIIYFDLPNFVKSQLKMKKISNIDMKNVDTFIKKNNFFSARRSLRLKHDDYGRNISIIMIN
jgi:YfiH family protein